MKIDILTLFPDMFKGPFDESIIKRAQDKGLVKIAIHNLRDWATDKHKTVDDHPFGGGVGMVLKVDILDNALQDIKKAAAKTAKTKTILLSAKGKTFNQKLALQLSKSDHLVLIAGHYEGVDERVAENLIDSEVSIGDYVLTGGELPVMVLVDSIVRLIPGVLEKSEATQSESFSPTTYNSQPTTMLEYPQYTRPENYKGWKVPKILLSGNHKEIDKWRSAEALAKTKKTRPDLLKNTKS